MMKMIRVTIELVPPGIEEEARTISSMIIANDGTGDSTTANYGYVWKDEHDGGEGGLYDFPRRNGIWDLIYKCLGSQTTHKDEKFMELIWEKIRK